MTKKYSTELVAFLEAWDKDELGNGAWQALLEGGVSAFNKWKGTNIDPHYGFLLYVEAKAIKNDRGN